MMNFANHSELSNDLAEAARAKIMDETDATDAIVRFSNLSASVYIYVTWEDDDGEYVREEKISFSDHAGGNHEEQHTIRFDGQIEEICDEDVDYSHIEIESWKFDEMVDLAVSFAS